MPVRHFSPILGILLLLSGLAAGPVGAAQAPAPGDEPTDVIAAFENRIADAIAASHHSVVAITRIPSSTGLTTAIKGQVPELVAPNDAMAVNILGEDPRRQGERPGFPNAASPEYLALPGEYGGGVVIGPKHEILTTYHLLRGAGRIRVRAEGASFDAEILAADPRTDLAVIVPREGESVPATLKPIPLGHASKLRQGSFLIAMGNPYNSARDGRASASMGILSNISRRLEPPSDENANIRQFFKFQATLLQLDSRLNLGMSGGAVINLKGELVGVTTSESSPGAFDAAAGYAIPLDPLGRRAISELLQGKEVEYGFIGIGLQAVVPNTISQVEKGTPAWQANLATNDKILSVGDITLTNDESSLQLALASVPVGEPVRLRVLHEGKEVIRSLIMSKYPVMGGAIATNRPAPWRGLRVDFTSVLSRKNDTERTLKSMSRGGVGITEVEVNSPASIAGLNPGQIITHVNDEAVSTPGEFREVVNGLGSNDVTLTLASEPVGKTKVVIHGK